MDRAVKLGIPLRKFNERVIGVRLSDILQAEDEVAVKENMTQQKVPSRLYGTESPSEGRNVCLTANEYEAPSEPIGWPTDKRDRLTDSDLRIREYPTKRPMQLSIGLTQRLQEKLGFDPCDGVVNV
jgi:hypothetical protein